MADRIYGIGIYALIAAALIVGTTLLLMAGYVIVNLWEVIL